MVLWVNIKNSSSSNDLHRVSFYKFTSVVHERFIIWSLKLFGFGERSGERENYVWFPHQKVLTPRPENERKGGKIMM